MQLPTPTCVQEAAEAQLEQEQELHAAELHSAEASLWSLMAEQAVAYEAKLAAPAQHGSAAAGLEVGGTRSCSTASPQTKEQGAVIQHLEEQHGDRVAELQAQLAEAQVLLSRGRELQAEALEQASTACCHNSVPKVHRGLERKRSAGCTACCHGSMPVVHLHLLHRSARAAAFTGGWQINKVQGCCHGSVPVVHLHTGLHELQRSQEAGRTARCRVRWHAAMSLCRWCTCTLLHSL